MSRVHSPGCLCVRCCDRDALRDNPIHNAERAEAHRALAALSETGRAVACRHTGRQGHTCPDCGDEIDRSDV